MPKQSLCNKCKSTECQCRACKGNTLKFTVCRGSQCGFDSKSNSCSSFVEKEGQR